MQSMTVSRALPYAFRSPRPNCCSQRMIDSVGVALGAAEGERPGAGPLPVLLESVGGARLGGDRLRQCLVVEPAAPPGDVGVVHLVGHAEVVEGDQEVPADTVEEIAPVDEVLLAEGEEVAAVGPLGGGGEAEEEPRPDVVDEGPVGAGGGVVELVHDEVVEGVPREVGEVPLPAEHLDGGEET